MLRGIRFESHCEHHMAPIIGQAWVAYIPSGRVVGISKLARVVDVYAKRLQIQEKMTAQIANTINDVLKPQGVGVVIKATHHCMTTRGVHKPDTDLVTSRMLGCFRDNALTRQEFLGDGRLLTAAAEAKGGETWLRSKLQPTGPDLAQGVASTRFCRWRQACSVMSATRRCCWCAAVRRYSRSSPLHAITTGRSPKASWSATGALPLAPRLLRSAHRRGAARAGPQPGRLLEGRAARRQDFRAAKSAQQPKPRAQGSGDAPGRIVIVGGGAAGFAAAEMLRRRGLSAAASSC